MVNRRKPLSFPLQVFPIHPLGVEEMEKVVVFLFPGKPQSDFLLIFLPEPKSDPEEPSKCSVTFSLRSGRITSWRAGVKSTFVAQVGSPLRTVSRVNVSKKSDA